MNEERKDIFKTWADSYTAVSRLWEDSYFRLYNTWFESTGNLFSKAIEISKNAAPEKYTEFYNEWMKTCQESFGSSYQIPTLESNKEIFEKLLVSAEESNKIYRSWITELEENSRRTREVLAEDPSPARYKEVYDMWIKSYGKIFDELLRLPFRQNIIEISERMTGVQDIYSEAIEEISRIWKDSFAKISEPWIDSMLKLSAKSAEISRNGVSPEATREFYDLWVKTYQETCGNIQSTQDSKEIFENFVRSANINLDMYKTSITTLENLSQKAKDLSQRPADPVAFKKYYSLWAKTYEKTFENFFEITPGVGPFKEVLEPVKNMTKIYADSFSRMSNMWATSGARSASAYPGKNK